MANAKRASMREGPLAALFRKTEEASEEPASPPRPESSPQPEGSRESGPPHPALSAPSETREQLDARDAPADIPTPRERLRHAFSSEIPENVMDPPSARPVMDGYTRQHPAASSNSR
jgi:cell division protein FtsZ